MAGTCAVTVGIFDGSRQLIRPVFDPLLTLRDGGQHTYVSKFVKGNRIKLARIPVHDNADDSYTVLVSARKHQDAGVFPIQVEESASREVSLMLLHRDASFHFSAARWDNLKSASPDLFRFLAGQQENLARQQYEQVMEDSPECLACLLNITTAIQKLPLPDPDKPLALFRWIELRRVDDPDLATGLRQDRFFAYADQRLVKIVESHADGKASPKLFEKAPTKLHHCADKSWKEIRFGEANLQFSFHSKDTCTIGRTECVKVEMDMDCYHDPLAHFFLEVVPNEVSTRLGRPHLTDPRAVYALRWMAGQNAETHEEFDPPYTVIADVQ